ncbi:unnamed protein product, partial [Laminaria digitata]
MLSNLGEKGVRHSFFTRSGGVSQGIYSGLNVGLGSGDNRTLVEENRARIAGDLGVEPDHLLTPYQVHSAKAVVVREPFGDNRPEADAVVTDRPGIAIGVVTADCGPVLFADPGAGVIAAAHAGWQGALGGILENTITVMEELGAARERIVAVLGPTISQASYEVGPEFVERFCASGPQNRGYFASSERDGHARFDLVGYTLDRLGRAGVSASATGQ